MAAAPDLKGVASEWLALFRAAAASWVADRAPSMGAAIAFYTVFSLGPILLLVVAIAGLAFGRRAAEGALIGEIADMVGRPSAAALEAVIRNAADVHSGIIATCIALGTLLAAATAVFVELQTSFNVIWHAKPRPGRRLWRLMRVRLLSLSLIVATGFLLLVSLVLSAALTAFSDYLASVLPGLPLVLRSVHLIISFGFTALLFGAMFKVLPDEHVAWRDVWFGAAWTALLFTAGKYLISLYIGSSRVASSYGAAGAFVVVLVWVFFSAQILLFGAELTKANADRHRRQSP
ncbi:MAG: YihY/virulence factor BrkB family protein [Alphaproteobacteria bacterium]